MANEEDIRRRWLGGMPIPDGGVFTEDSRRSMLDTIHLENTEDEERMKAAAGFFRLLGE